MKTKEITKFLKKNQKPLLIALVVLVVIVVVWVVVKKIRTFIAKKNIQNDAETLTDSELTPGLHHGELLAQIAEACKGLGTNENAIYSALEQLRTSADWEYMKTAWSLTFSELSSWERSLARVMGLSQSLTATLASELDRSELQHCRDILEEKNIVPGF